MKSKLTIFSIVSIAAIILQITYFQDDSEVLAKLGNHKANKRTFEATDYSMQKNHFTRVIKLLNNIPSEQKYLSNIINLQKIKFSHNVVDNSESNLSGKNIVNFEISKSTEIEICNVYSDNLLRLQTVNLNSLPNYHPSKINLTQKINKKVFRLSGSQFPDSWLRKTSNEILDKKYSQRNFKKQKSSILEHPPFSKLCCFNNAFLNAEYCQGNNNIRTKLKIYTTV